MSKLSWVPRISSSESLTAQPFTQAVPYVNGAYLGSSQFANVARINTSSNTGILYLVSASVIDTSGTFGQYDVWFFTQQPDAQGSNAVPFSISNASISSCVAVISLGQVYSTSAGSNGISLDGAGIWKQIPITDIIDVYNLYVVYVLRTPGGINGFPDFNDLTFRFDFLME